MAFGRPGKLLFVVQKVFLYSWRKPLPVCELQHEIKDILAHQENPA